MTTSMRCHRSRVSRSVADVMLLAATLLFGIASPLAAQAPPPDRAKPVAIGRVEVGFQEGLTNLVRPDAYAPVTVSLQNRSGQIFTGSLQVLGRDRDGESVIYQVSNFGLNTGEVKDLALCCFIRPGQQGVIVRLLDGDGRFVDAASADVELIADGEHLVVDVSPQSLVAVLASAFRDDLSLRLRGTVRVASFRMRGDIDRPQDWYELEAADVILCNQSDDLGLGRDSRAWEALAHWVRQGGLLVVGPGTHQTLQGTSLYEALPAEPGELIQLPRGTIAARGLNNEIPLDVFRDASFWPLVPKSGAAALLKVPLGGEDKPVLVRRRMGFGSILQSGVSLRVLLEAKDPAKAGTGTRLRPELLGLRTLDVPPEEAGLAPNPDAYRPWPGRSSPSQLFRDAADFRAAGTILATLLLLLTVAYGLAATVGTWAVLKVKKRTQYSWLVFTAVAVAGSAAAGLLVQSARGIRGEVKQHSVVDLDAATGVASIRTFHGLRMPFDASVRVGVTTAGQRSLPPEQQETAFVRPAADLTRGLMGTFAVQREYAVPAGLPVLPSVPIRATAKQFESYWSGPVGGTIESSLAFDGVTGRLSAGSWIRNGTPWNLRECYLLVTRVPYFNTPQRDATIGMLPLGSLQKGEVFRDFPRFYRMRGSSELGTAPDPRYWLSDQAMNWMGVPPSWSRNQRQQYGPYPQADPLEENEYVPRSVAERARDAIMMTLLSELPTKKASDQNTWTYYDPAYSSLLPFSQLSRPGTRWMDLRNVLDGHSALLIAIVEEPGPVRLAVNGEPVEPSEAGCIIRVALPVAGMGGD